MLDRPSTTEMLEVVRQHLEKQVIPALGANHKLQLQILVAVHLLGIIEREMQTGIEPLQEEWKRLNYVQNVTTPFPTDLAQAREALAARSRQLCDEIRAGRYDYLPQRAALFEHLLVTVRQQLEISNPKFLQILTAEDKKPS